MYKGWELTECVVLIDLTGGVPDVRPIPIDQFCREQNVIGMITREEKEHTEYILHRNAVRAAGSRRTRAPIGAGRCRARPFSARASCNAAR